MKKGFVTLMVIGMMAASALPVFAEDMTVEYTKAPTYTLSIPTTLTLSETAQQTAPIGVSAINVGRNQSVQVKAASNINTNGEVTLTDVKDSAHTCTSKVSLITGGAAIGLNDVVATFRGTSTTPTAGGKLYFAPLTNLQAGTYKGTMTFSAGVVND